MTLDVTQQEAVTTATVLASIRFNEHDSDHEETLTTAIDALRDALDDDVELRHGEFNPSVEQVETALTVLRQEGEDYGGLDDTWTIVNTLDAAWEFVERETKNVNGSLPEPRTWTVEYRANRGNGPIIEEREYDFADEIPTRPCIDGTDYDFVRREDDKYDPSVTIYVEEAS